MTTMLANILHYFRGPPQPTLEERLAAIDWAALRWRFLHSWVNEHCEIAPGCDISEETWQAISRKGMFEEANSPQKSL